MKCKGHTRLENISQLIKKIYKVLNSLRTTVDKFDKRIGAMNYYAA